MFMHMRRMAYIKRSKSLSNKMYDIDQIDNDAQLYQNVICLRNSLISYIRTVYYPWSDQF